MGKESVIVDMIGYDEQGHTVYTKLGNGTETTYAYDRERQRLQEMNLTAGGNAVMQNKYRYDAVDNILGIVNIADPQGMKDFNAAKLGGASSHEYQYDELNRLMVLSDNGKTSRYTYNHAGERVVKSHGTMEGVYINGAPQGITFHETDEYTIYPASILTVSKNRFTKHYFIGDKRVASRIGTGQFNNVYGQNGSYVTAGQQDYTERLNQIQSKKEDYYKELGIAPGVPTMKGAYGDPENTGVGYNTVITELGDHSVPEGWIQTPKRNTEPNTVPGTPVSWNDPIKPENPDAGYGFIPSDTADVEETFFFHSDHLGSTSYITDQDGNITQYDAYLPYGELLVDEHSSSEEMPYKFNGKELDEETGLYYYGARYMQPVASIWYGVDQLAEKYVMSGSYVYCLSNPVKLFDPDGKKGVLVHGTWSDESTWKDIPGLQKATKNLFNDGNIKHYFTWSGGNYRAKRTEAAKHLVYLLKTKVELGEFSAKEPITLIGHSHGGNVIIEAVNLLVKDPAFKDIKINILTINTPVRPDYQLSKTAQQRVSHVNIYDPADPVQANGGNERRLFSETPNNIKPYGEVGRAGRTFRNARNIEVDDPQGIINAYNIGTRNEYFTFGDWHNSHNRVDTWINKTKNQNNKKN